MKKYFTIIFILIALIQINCMSINMTIAAKNNDFKSLEKFVTEGRKINVIDECWRRTPLIWAAYNLNYDMVEYLVNKGSLLDVQDVYGSTALMYAAYYNNIQIVKILVDKGANLNLKDNAGLTSLRHANTSDPDVIAYLKEHGATE